MSVCCVNCGIYFGEYDTEVKTFCCNKCEKQFLKDLKNGDC